MNNSYSINPYFARLFIFTTFLLLGISSLNADEEYRVFTNDAGQEIQAKIIDAQSGRVKMELADRRIMWVDDELFCKEDQEYINKWRMDHILSDPKSFRFQIEQITTVKERSRSIDSTSFSFKLSVTNRSGQDLEGLTLDYEMFYNESGFYENEGFGIGTEVTFKDDAVTLRSAKGQLKLESLPNGTSKELTTKDVNLTLYAQKGAMNWDMEDEKHSWESAYYIRTDEMLGCIMQFKRGDKILFTTTYPDNFRKPNKED